MDGFNLDEEELLRQYRELQYNDIDRLFEDYGTSLKEMREMYPQLVSGLRGTKAGLGNETIFFTPDEVKDMGVSLQEGWMLKLTPNETGKYQSSLISPQKWEITEGGEYISPTGERYSQAALQALLNPAPEPQTITPIQESSRFSPEALQYGAQEFERWTGKPISVEEYAKGFTEPKLTIEDIFGKVFPKQSLEEVSNYMSTNPEGFIKDIQEIGPTEDVVNLLKSLEFKDEQGNVEHLTDEEIQGLFTEPVTKTEAYIPESKWKDTWDAFVVGGHNFIQSFKEVFTGILPGAVAPFYEESMTEKALSSLHPIGGIVELIKAKTTPRTPTEQQVINQIETQSQERFLKLMQENNEWMAQHPELTPRPEYLENPFENPKLLKDPGYWGYNITSNLAYTLGVMGAMVAGGAIGGPAGALGAGFVFASTPETSSMVEQLINQGVPYEQAIQWGMLGGAIGGGVEEISDIPFLGLVFKPLKPAIQPLLKGIQKATTNAVAKAALSGFTITQIEGVEELVTQAAQNAILKHFDETQSILQGVSQAYIQAVMSSLPFGAVGGMASFRTFRSNLSQETGKQYDDIVDRLKKAGANEQQAQMQATNELARNPEFEPELSEAIGAAQKEYWDEHPEARPVEKPIMPDISEQILNDIEVAEEVTKKVTPVTPEVAAKEPWTMGALDYQTKILQVEQPSISEISPTQYASLSKRQKEIYDKKRDTEWNAAANAKAKWRDLVLAAYKEGKITLETPNLHPEAREAILLSNVREREAVKEQTLREATERNDIKSIDEVKVGDRVWSVMANRYGTVIKKFKNSVKLHFEESLGGPTPTNEETYNVRGLKWQSYDDLRATLVTPEIKSEIPKAPPGMTEAGLQAGMPGVTAKEVSPEAKGRLVQTRLNDYLNLRKYNKKAVEDRIAEIKEALAKSGRLPKELGLKGNLKLELARLEALQKVEAVERPEELDFLIKEVANEISNRSLPYHGRTKNRFPEYTTRQLDEIMKVYQEARQNLTPETPQAPLPETPQAPLPEPPKPTLEEQEIVKTDPTPASDEIILKKFIDCIEDAKPAREETEELKHQELQRRAAIYASILQGGEGHKAFDKAKAALKGPLPKAEYILDLQKFDITDAEIERMFDRIRLDDNLRPFQKLNTAEAFTNLLMGQIPTEGELILLEKEFGTEFVKAVMKKMPTSQKVIRNLQDIANVPRTLVTIADLSATFRQAAVLSIGQPVQFAHAFEAQVKAMFSEKNFKIIDEIIHNNVYAEKGEQHGLYIAPTEYSVGVAAREEAFMGRLLERIPALGSVVRASERAYITMLNVIRMETWAYYCRQWEGTGKTVADYDKLADFINHATGRGDLGSFSRASPWLSATFFSPRFIMARIELPLDIITTTPAVRKVAARNLVSWVGVGAMALTLAELAGAEIEKDPRSTDFGKIKIGNTRIDYWAGFQPYVRMLSQIITAQKKVTATGAIIEADRIQIAENFLRSKLAPVPGLVWDLTAGETFIGEELTPENAPKIVFEKLVPMYIQDMVEAIKDCGIAGVGYGTLSGLGLGVQTYSDNWVTLGEKLGLPVRSEALPYTIINQAYDLGDYYSEVSKMIGEATYEMLSKKKNVPQLVLSVAQAKDIQREIDLLPNQRLININADSSKGDTYEQYHAQWLARQKITDKEELAQFDKDYPKAELGNMTQAQYALLAEYNSLTEDQKAEFLAKHPELYTNPREEWLRNHPGENAILALWGKANIYSLEALEKMHSLAKSLDIPESAMVFKEPDEITKLRIKTKPVSDLEDALKGLDDTIKDANGFTAKDRALNDLYTKNPEYRDDIRRIEALKQGTEKNPTLPDIVEAWVERGKLVDEYGANSAEARLWLLDNKEVHKWALDHGLLTDDGSDWNEPILRLQVQYREQFDLYDAYGDVKSDKYIRDDDTRAKARKALLFDKQGNLTGFGTAYYTMEASRQGYSETNWNAYVEYSGLPSWGSWRERYLLEHPDLYKEYTDPKIGKHPLIDETKVRPLQRDMIYKQFYDEFQRWDDTAGMSPKQIENMRAGLLDVEKGGITFGKARYKVEAYDLGVPEKYIDLYADYYQLPVAGYDQERFLMEHQDYYRDVWLGILKNEPKDFNKIPSKEVEKLYAEYQKLPAGNVRLDFRAKHPDLDAWLFQTNKVSKLVGDRGNPEAEKTPWEEWAEVKEWEKIL